MTDLGAVRAVLSDAQRVGLLGPEPVDHHIRHAETWASILEPTGFLDLGSGAGVPGLVFATVWPDVPATLLDGQLRRAAWLQSAVARLGLHPRVSVLSGRAEEVGHEQICRERYPLVLARAFGPPATVAECGAPLVQLGGLLSISEPPDSSEERWPAAACRSLGLDAATGIVRDGASFVILSKTSESPALFPRPRPLPWKSPLW
ncbi:MAG: RsmG family class I SAM-dependent methyltransferase [Acidimicrobiia bacterium]